MTPTSFLAPSGGWEMKEVTVVGAGGRSSLLFRESSSSGASDGSGPYLDNVVVQPVSRRRHLRSYNSE